MLRVSLDTTCFTADSHMRGPPFKSLMRLVKEGKVSLHISELVIREQRAHLEDETRKAIEGILNSSKAAGASDLPDELREFAARVAEAGEKLLTGLINASVRPFEQWLDEYRVDVVPITGKHHATVLENYFTGCDGFAGRRSRRDFPDAFIFQGIRDLAVGSDGPLYFVSNDKNLRGTCSSIDGVEVFATLQEFLGSDDCIPLFADDHARENLAAVRRIGREDLTGRLEWLKRSLREWILGQPLTIVAEQPPVLPRKVEDIREAMFHCDEAVYIGDGIVTIPFQADVRVFVVVNLGVSVASGRTLESAIEGYPVVRVEGTVSFKMPAEFLRPPQPGAVAEMFNLAKPEISPTIGPVWGI